MIYPGENKEGRLTAGDYVLAAERIKADRSSLEKGDLVRAERWEAKARTKLPSTQTAIGAGGELIHLESERDARGLVNTVAEPDYVAVAASRDRLDLADEARSLDLALDAADTIKAQDSLEKMLVHQMAVLHRGVMKAATLMNQELDAVAIIHESTREARNVRACRLAAAISRMSGTYQQGLLTLQRWRTGGAQHVTVKHVHQQVNVTEGGQAVVAGDKIASSSRGRRGINGRGHVSK